MLKTLLVLVGVLGLIIVLAYAFRRYGPAGLRGEGGAEGWRVLGMKALGPKKQVFLIEVGTRVLVVGVTDRAINTLADLTESKDREIVLAATNRPSAARFRDLLRRAEA